MESCRHDLRSVPLLSKSKLRRRTGGISSPEGPFPDPLHPVPDVSFPDSPVTYGRWVGSPGRAHESESRRRGRGGGAGRGDDRHEGRVEDVEGEETNIESGWVKRFGSGRHGESDYGLGLGRGGEGSGKDTVST